MGTPKFPRKKYDTPQHPWKEERIKEERDLLKKYGLKNHREVWKVNTYIKKYREQARELLAKVGATDPQIKRESDQLLMHLTRMGMLSEGASLDDVLTIDAESILSRRLQTLVYHRGLANTISHARQLVSHGHIAIGDHKVTIPSYLVTMDEENEIGYTDRSPLNTVSHPARPRTDVYKPGVAPPVEPKVPEKEEKKEEPAKPPKAEEPEKPEKKEEEKPEKEEEAAKEEPEPSEEAPPEPEKKAEAAAETGEAAAETKEEPAPAEEKAGEPEAEKPEEPEKKEERDS